LYHAPVQSVWCWRCQQDITMLSDDEYAAVVDETLPSRGGTYRERLELMLRAYERVTGEYETNPNAIFHHQVSRHGPRADRAADPSGPRVHPFVRPAERTLNQSNSPLVAGKN
jgi:hypothetical protein